jgi:hypothetical protein
MTADLERAAGELCSWFSQLLALCDRTVFAVSTHEPHRQAAVLGVLTRNAKIIVHGELDAAGALYTPLCFVLGAACRRLGVEPSDRQWLSAISNVLRLEEQLRDAGATMALAIGTPAGIFKQQLDEALINAGVTDRPTILDRHNRDLALGLGLNWGLRFLVAYALEAGPQAQDNAPDARDLRWVKHTVRQGQLAA